MVKSEIYIGLHDSTTKTQLFESEKYIRVLRNVCHSYKVPFSFGIQEGGYIYENGEYARESYLFFQRKGAVVQRRNKVIVGSFLKVLR